MAAGSAQRMLVCASHSPLMDEVPGGEPGDEFVRGLDQVKRFVSTFDPDLVIFFGPDHARAFTSVVPAFALVTSASGYGDWGTSKGAYDIPADRARELAGHLLDDGLDITVAADARLDHGFAQTFQQLLGELDAVPVIPIVINCATPPLPPLNRVTTLGASTGAFFVDADERILFVGSGGLSHSPPSMAAKARFLSEDERRTYNLSRLEQASRRINVTWDRRFLDALERLDWAWIESLTKDQIEVGGSGAHEVRTWAAAVAAADLAPRRVAYAAVPSWITGMAIAASQGAHA